MPLLKGYLQWTRKYSIFSVKFREIIHKVYINVNNEQEFLQFYQPSSGNCPGGRRLAWEISFTTKSNTSCGSFANVPVANRYIILTSHTNHMKYTVTIIAWNYRIFNIFHLFLPHQWGSPFLSWQEPMRQIALQLMAGWQWKWWQVDWICSLISY